MKVAELTPAMCPSGTRVRVTRVAPSESERRGYHKDGERLRGATGTVRRLNSGGTRFAQLDVEWDSREPGTLMLASEDEVEILSKETATEG